MPCIHGRSPHKCHECPSYTSLTGTSDHQLLSGEDRGRLKEYHSKQSALYHQCAPDASQRSSDAVYRIAKNDYKSPYIRELRDEELYPTQSQQTSVQWAQTAPPPRHDAPVHYSWQPQLPDQDRQVDACSQDAHHVPAQARPSSLSYHDLRYDHEAYHRALAAYQGSRHYHQGHADSSYSTPAAYETSVDYSPHHAQPQADENTYPAESARETRQYYDAYHVSST